MADEIDRAQARDQERREDALRHRKPEAPKEGGECLWCGDRLPVTRRWCNSECRDAWQRDQILSARAGDGTDL